MASIHSRAGSKKWHCSFLDRTTGKWRLISTGTDDKQEALAVCQRYELLSRQAAPKPDGTVSAGESGELLEAALSIIATAKRGELSESTGREFINRVHRAAGLEEITARTTKDFLTAWLAGRTLSLAEATGRRYRTTIEMFIESLGKRGSAQLSSISHTDVERFRDARLLVVSALTVADDMKILRTAFNTARRQKAIIVNPCEEVDYPKGEAATREAFTPGEAVLLAKAAPNDDWRTMILLGFYAGLRLGDAANLKWDAVDFDAGLIRYKAAKTGAVMETPMHPVLQKHLEKIAGDSTGAISPTLAQKNVSGRAGMSRQFLAIVRAAGLETGTEKAEGRARSFSKRSFHSLRHGFVSALANAGIAPELRQKLSGHSTESSHKKYTHLELETLRTALASIPSR